MRDKTSVEHIGVVEEIKDQIVRVGFVSHSACSGCHARGACSLSDVESKYVEVHNGGNDFSTGEKVNILLKQSQGFQALWLGYVLPFIIMVLTLIIVMAVSKREGLAGLAGISALVPYYLGLYLFRDRVREKFEFIIRKTV